MSEKEKPLGFLFNNPGASKYGNFINYYQFHPVENRIKSLPTDIWSENNQEVFVALDIGCNAGNLTWSIYNFLKSQLKARLKVLAIDIDPILIERAQEQFPCEDIKFICLDVMSPQFESAALENLREFSNGKTMKFNASFCFSTTMWIHLNHGDNGLKVFLSNLCQLSELVIIEPQPWKCYKSAVKRLKDSNLFPMFTSLAMTKNIESDIEKFIVESLHLEKNYESPKSNWGRKIFIFSFHK